MRNETMIPARPVSPGQIIKRELEARGWTQKNLAEILGRPEQTISEIVRSRKRITPETALQLGEAFGTSAALWLNLESKYRLAMAATGQSDASGIARRSRLYELAPISEIIKRNWIGDVESIDDLEREVCRFLGIEDPSQQVQMPVSFRHSETREPQRNALIAWARRAEYLASTQTVALCEVRRLENAIPELLTLAGEAADTARVPPFLEELGVRFVVLPHLSRTYLDGAAFSCESGATVAMTLRYDRIDNFWFTLLHELAHIVAGHEGVFLDNLDEPSGDREETEADQLARDWLVGIEAYTDFVVGTEPYFSEAKIRGFARQVGLHPGIVLGRLHHDGHVPHRNLRRLLVKVSEYLAPWIDGAELAS
jgi:HTH-type transcriptional regulator/antitoxin HigA